MDSDRILVLSHGTVSQLGTPEELISESDGDFAKLWKESTETR